jgi:hypothetical protein
MPVEDELPVARYAAVWSKNYSIKKSASVLVELAKQSQGIRALKSVAPGVLKLNYFYRRLSISIDEYCFAIDKRR